MTIPKCNGRQCPGNGDRDSEFALRISGTFGPNEDSLFCRSCLLWAIDKLLSVQLEQGAVISYLVIPVVKAMERIRETDPDAAKFLEGLAELSNNEIGEFSDSVAKT